MERPLDHQEFAQMIKDLGVDLIVSELKTLLDKLDPNGYNKISLKDFARALSSD